MLTIDPARALFRALGFAQLGDPVQVTPMFHSERRCSTPSERWMRCLFATRRRRQGGARTHPIVLVDEAGHDLHSLRDLVSAALDAGQRTANVTRAVAVALIAPALCVRLISV